MKKTKFFKIKQELNKSYLKKSMGMVYFALPEKKLNENAACPSMGDDFKIKKKRAGRENMKKKKKLQLQKFMKKMQFHGIKKGPEHFQA